MKKLGLTVSEAAISDVLDQADWYEQRADMALSRRWERAVFSVYLRLLQHPHLGAACSFDSDKLQGVRRASVPGFARHLVFYRIEETSSVILRVLHGARDLEPLF